MACAASLRVCECSPFCAAQVIIFVRSTARANQLNQLLLECNFPSICVHGALKQEERIERYQQFKKFEKRILVGASPCAA